MLPLPAAWGVIFVAALVGCGNHAGPGSADQTNPAASATNSTQPAKPAPAAQAVELVVDYGDGVLKRISAIPWQQHMTVLDALKAAGNRPHGITFASRGAGPTAFVIRLDDVENQGGATSAKNWTFRVNDRLQDESCGLVEIKPGDSILWKFGAYE